MQRTRGKAIFSQPVRAVGRTGCFLKRVCVAAMDTVFHLVHDLLTLSPRRRDMGVIGRQRFQTLLE